jgi:hypothetical protein
VEPRTMKVILRSCLRHATGNFVELVAVAAHVYREM